MEWWQIAVGLAVLLNLACAAHCICLIRRLNRLHELWFDICVDAWVTRVWAILPPDANAEITVVRHQ